VAEATSPGRASVSPRLKPVVYPFFTEVVHDAVDVLSTCKKRVGIFFVW
jgi:hypothetical protein